MKFVCCLLILLVFKGIDHVDGAKGRGRSKGGKENGGGGGGRGGGRGSGEGNDCVCTMYGDPHVSTFENETLRLPLPCSHVITEMVTESSGSKSSCHVSITGLASYHSIGHSDPKVSFESLIDMNVVHPKFVFKTRLNASGVSITRFQTTPNSRVDEIQPVLDAAGFYNVDIPQCDIMVKFRGHAGSFSLTTSPTTFQSTGMCGWCRDPDDSLLMTNPSAGQALQMYLSSLAYMSLVDATDLNIYPGCTELTKSYRKCPQKRKQFAFDFCGEMLTNHHVRKCMARRYGRQQVLIDFAMCYEAVCSGAKSCNEYANFYQGCPASHLTAILNMAAFCVL